MARPLRLEYEGALYHITARVNEKNPIYTKKRGITRNFSAFYPGFRKDMAFSSTDMY